MGIWYISRKHRLDCLLGIMLGTDLAMINIIGNVRIYSGPGDGGLGEVSHLLYASVIVVEITEHPLIQCRGYTHSVCIQYSILNCQLIPGAPEELCYAGNFLESFRPAIQGQLVYGAVDRISLHSSSDYV